METKPYEMRVFSHDHGDFRDVSDTGVLIYWPHGFGDWVFLSYIVPLLESSNRYWVTRFGDDSSALFEGSLFAMPSYMGCGSPAHGNGELFGNANFGLRYEDIDGGVRILQLPIAIYDLCRKEGINVLLWSHHPESHGFIKYPYHTKARRLLPNLVPADRLNQLDLSQPLRSGIEWEVAPWLLRWVEARLKRYGFGDRKLCLISRSGYSTPIKNWGHFWREDLPQEKQREGEECRDFMRLLLKKDPYWMFLVTEDRPFEGEHTMRSDDLHCFSYAQLFGTVGTTALPFGLVMKTLVQLSSLVVGVPTGPYHLSMAYSNTPTVGLWLSHLPWWYDEPKKNSVHLIGRNVTDQGLNRRPGSVFPEGALSFRAHWLSTRIITGENVFNAVEDFL